MLDFDAVRAIGLGLPGVVDAKTYGAPALKLNGETLACVPVNKSVEANCALVRIGFQRRAQLLQEHPKTYYITDHYASHPTVLVRLGQITRKDLRKVLREAWSFVSAHPKGLRTKRRVRLLGVAGAVAIASLPRPSMAPEPITDRGPVEGSVPHLIVEKISLLRIEMHRADREPGDRT